MMKTHWEDRSKQWGKIGPPLNPNQEIVDALTDLIPIDHRILLLGVTPQVANTYTHVTAVDFSPPMIERVWPGDTETKRAIEANWLTIEMANDQFDGIIGDGSINMVSYPTDVRAVFERCYHWLKPGGRFAMRFFTRPDEPITREYLLAEAGNPTVNFSAFRRLLPMHIAHIEGSCVPHTRTLELFEELFPDRSVLKWDTEHISSMDAYRGTTTSTWFPTRSEILEFVHPRAQDVHFVDVGTYDIAHTCPILTFTR